jgi:hypothetical protein
MAPLARAFRLSEPTLGRSPCSFLSSPRDVVPLVPIFVSSSRVLRKRAWIILTISSFFCGVAECSVRLGVTCQVLFGSGRVPK